jgi:hypothetical protein
MTLGFPLGPILTTIHNPHSEIRNHLLTLSARASTFGGIA